MTAGVTFRRRRSSVLQRMLAGLRSKPPEHRDLGLEKHLARMIAPKPRIERTLAERRAAKEAQR